MFKSDLAEAWLGRGNISSDLKQYEDAATAFDRALALKPDLAEAWLGRGKIWTELKQYDRASAAFDAALARKPDLAKAWLGRGRVFTERGQHGEALAAYDRALALDPDLDYAAGARLDAKLYLCDWTNLKVEIAGLLAEVRERKPACLPFSLLALPSLPARAAPMRAPLRTGSAELSGDLARRGLFARSHSCRLSLGRLQRSSDCLSHGRAFGKSRQIPFRRHGNIVRIR